MMKLLALLLLTSPAFAGPYGGSKIDTANGIVVSTQPGTFCFSAHTSTVEDCTVLIDGVTGEVDGYDLSEQLEAIALSTSAVSTVRTISTLVGQTSSSSQEWASVVGSTLTLNLGNESNIGIDFNCNLECVDNTQCGASIAFLIDSEFGGATTGSTDSGIMYLKTSASLPGVPSPLIINHQTVAKYPEGNHTLSLLWASDAGVQVQMGRNTSGCSLTYREEPDEFGTGASGTIAIYASSITAVVNGALYLGAYTIPEMQTTLTCPALPCEARTDTGIWIATGTLLGQWMNVFSGLGP